MIKCVIMNVSNDLMFVRLFVHKRGMSCSSAEGLSIFPSFLYKYRQWKPKIRGYHEINGSAMVFCIEHLVSGVAQNISVVGVYTSSTLVLLTKVVLPLNQPLMIRNGRGK